MKFDECVRLLMAHLTLETATKDIPDKALLSGFVNFQFFASSLSTLRFQLVTRDIKIRKTVNIYIYCENVEFSINNYEKGDVLWLKSQIFEL